MTISAACAAPIPTAIPMSVVKSSFRIVFSRNYLSKCVAVTDFPFFPQKTGTTHYRTVTPGFFCAKGIPLLEGRLMAESDRDHPIAVVSAQAARRLWPNQNAIGRRFQLGSDAWFEVIGISGDVRRARLLWHGNAGLSLWQPPSTAMAAAGAVRASAAAITARCAAAVAAPGTARCRVTLCRSRIPLRRARRIPLSR